MVKTSYPKEIQFFLEEITTKIKDALNPDFILIAGSFGKKSWLYSGDELISDFEFVFVCNKRWSLKKKKLLLKKFIKEYPYDISLKGYLSEKIHKKVISNYSSRNPGYISLDFFDTFSNPNFLYVRNDEYIEINCTNDEIPIWEAWRLYVNRMGDLLSLETSNDHDSKIINYYWLKIYESTADAYCIINKLYDKNIVNRLEIFTKELIFNDNELSDVCKNSLPIIRRALEARANHNLKLFENEISIDHRKKIIISWMDYFKKKMFQQEQISMNKNDNFYLKYLKNKNIQKKYLGFTSNYSILASNIIKLLYNPNLIGFNFRFFNQNHSWRHIILLSIASAFREESLKIENFTVTKEIIGKVLPARSINKLSKVDFLKVILKHWKILR